MYEFFQGNGKKSNQNWVTMKSNQIKSEFSNNEKKNTNLLPEQVDIDFFPPRKLAWIRVCVCWFSVDIDRQRIMDR